MYAKWISIILIAVVLSAASCDRGSPVDPPIPAPVEFGGPVPRYVDIAYADLRVYEVPVSVAVGVFIRHGEEDIGIREVAVDRLEIDFGDGGGWKDVTEDSKLEYDFDHFGGYTIAETEHVYPEPGIFLLRFRATFWDGEVVYNSISSPVITAVPSEPVRLVFLKSRYVPGGLRGAWIKVDVYIKGGEMDETDEEAWAEKIEVNFGDGTGWHDYTEELHQYYRGELTWAGLPTYSITEPGTYTIRCRATYWDGEVVYSDPPFETTFTLE